MSSLRHHLRLQQGAGAVFTLAKACELLPVTDAVAAADLEAAGLVRTFCGRRVVVWGDVLDHLRGGLPQERRAPELPTAAPLPKRVKLP